MKFLIFLLIMNNSICEEILVFLKTFSKTHNRFNSWAMRINDLNISRIRVYQYQSDDFNIFNLTRRFTIVWLWITILTLSECDSWQPYYEKRHNYLQRTAVYWEADGVVSLYTYNWNIIDQKLHYKARTQLLT